MLGIMAHIGGKTLLFYVESVEVFYCNDSTSQYIRTVMKR